MAKKAAKKTMKAQVFYEPLKMAYEDAPMPEIGADEVLVRVKACGICGSDIAYYYGMSSLETPTGKGPLILGHEYTGEVVEVGSIATKLFKPGDRVVLDPVQYCNACDVCFRGQTNLCENKAVLGVSTNGGFAEYSKSKYTGVHPLPDNVSYENGALTEPLACATYGIKNLAVEPGNFCVVIGPGAIGCMMVQLAKSSGAGTVVLVGGPNDDYRLAAGAKLGADVVINATEKGSPYYVADVKAKIAEMTGGKMANRVIVPTGAVPGMEMALAISGRRSTIVFFGLPGDKDVLRVPVLQSILWDKTIRFSWLAPGVWQTALGALAAGLVDVSPLVSRAYPLKDLAQALGDVKDRVGNPMKPVVVP